MLKRLQNAAVIALAACVVIGFGVAVWFAASQPPKIQSSARHEANSTHENYAEYCERKPYKTFGQHVRCDPVAYFTAWLTGFTAVLAASTIGLWIATGLTLRHSRITAERQLRAYLHVENVVMSLMDSEWNPNIQVIIKNYGQTPAYRITNIFKCIPLNRKRRERDFSLDQKNPAELADLAPTQQIFSTTSLPINQWNELKPLLISKERAFFVFGRIDYYDAFGHHRWTEYRFRLMVDAEGIPDERDLIMDGHAGNRST